MSEITLNPQQEEAVSHCDGPMIVLSVAGSGKTMVLIERIIHLIENGTEPAGLLAITFAKKAVLEIQSRLGKRLNGNANRPPVCTFHSLRYRILMAENPLGAGIRLAYDGDQLDLFRRAMEEGGQDENPPSLMRKVCLAKNDLISPENLGGSTKPE
jgi:superfamily I DNA/RNA helicase